MPWKNFQSCLSPQVLAIFHHPRHNSACFLRQEPFSSVTFWDKWKTSAPSAYLHLLHEYAAEADLSVFHHKDWITTSDPILLYLIEQFHSGDYLFVFSIAITLLERALNPRKQNLLLRQILAAEEVAAAIPTGAIPCLEALLLPSGLNLRNLVWHGFLTAIEFPRAFGSLLLLLLQPGILFPSPGVRPSGGLLLSSFDESLNERAQPCCEYFREKKALELSELGDLIDLLLQHSPEMESLWTTSGLMSSVNARQFDSAIQDLKNGYELSFLFRALPILEQLIRRVFCKVNANVDELLYAHQGQYYSTLDGYGQRTKHQVLLCDTLFNSGKENRLYQELPTGVMHACLDLFLLPEGPALRAKLCHGQCDLASLSSSQSRYSLLSSLLISIFMVLGNYKNTQSDPIQQRLCTAMQKYQSLFHPTNVLIKEICRGYSSFEFLRQQLQSLAYTITLEQKDIWFTFSGLQRNGHIITIKESSRRCVASSSFSSDYRKVVHLPTLLLKFVHPKLLMIFQHLVQRLKSGKWDFIPRFEANIDALKRIASEFEFIDVNFSCTQQPLHQCIDPPSPYFYSTPSASGCLIAIAQACQSTSLAFASRLKQQSRVVSAGTASTSQRRSFLSSLFFKWTIDSVLLLCLARVEIGLRGSEVERKWSATKCFQFIESFAGSLRTSQRSYEALAKTLLVYLDSFQPLLRCSDE